MNEFNLLKEMSFRARETLTPVGMVLELTPRCTLDCKMCYCHLTEEQMGDRKELSTEQWIKLIDEGYEKGAYAVLLTGGECLLHKGFWEIYDHAKSIGLIVSVNSNGTTITDEVIARFQKNPPRQVQISLYGSNEEIYERVTGHRVFKKVTDNIIKLKNAGVNVDVAVTPNKYLIDDLANLIEFLQTNGIRYNVNNNLMSAYDETGRSIDDFGLTPDEIVQVKMFLQKLKGDALYRNLDAAEKFLEKNNNGKAVSGLSCSGGRSSFVMCWDGTMIPCFWLSNERANYLELGFDEAWKCMNKAVDSFVLPAECRTCKYRPYCAGCALYRTDPRNPGHCNPKVCEETIGLYKKGYFGPNHKDEL